MTQILYKSIYKYIKIYKSVCIKTNELHENSKDMLISGRCNPAGNTYFCFTINLTKHSILHRQYMNKILNRIKIISLFKAIELEGTFIVSFVE